MKNTPVMKNIVLNIVALLASVSTFSFRTSTNHNLTVSVTGIRNSKGEIDCNLYSSADGFPKDVSKACKHLRGKINDGTCTVIFENVPGGKYAVSIYHDENNDHTFNTTWYGKPAEGVGISNGAKGGIFGPPPFEDALFNLDREKRIEINMVYL
ncbi:DUF2141 domain-containing protein [Cytophagaceae bacterium YF14B1]|uniref:DUF2141 domain-containing protein n=1 Tax=Xanthocytophaga flava TaxID=3048013 RepID=A0AAE3QL21_9BACT|nr:DUF2141 domain-containing protein [Xanthocytophaga flavus]MDJ1480900.1 DUF2141 domain-containing protein [Xanthocytophaga flavus]